MADQPPFAVSTSRYTLVSWDVALRTHSATGRSTTCWGPSGETDIRVAQASGTGPQSLQCTPPDGN